MGLSCWGVHDGVFLECKGRETQNGLRRPVNTPFPAKANGLGKVLIDCLRLDAVALVAAD
jgi:hypothetical protein